MITAISGCQGPFHDQHPDEHFYGEERVKGIHLFSRHKPGKDELRRLKKLEINTLVLVPYFYQRGLNSDTLFTSSIRGYEWTERDEGIEHLLSECKKHGLEAIIKPHLWPVNTENGEWRESVWPDSAKWEKWSNSYTSAIMHYAEMSEKYNLKIFCIGTELKKLTLEKPQYWRNLISEIRKVYSGKLVYAANWYEEYEKIEFWDQLDFIGVQAYFPLSSKDSSDLEFMKKEWEEHSIGLKKQSLKFDKPVLFTELGYRSSPNAGIEPWAWDEHWNGPPSEEESSEKMQKLCYESFFETVWAENWFAGVMLWNWKSPYSKFGGKTSSSFSPQRKAAEKTIEYYFRLN